MRLEGMPIEVDYSPNETAVLYLARTHMLTVYDAAYLELAKRKNIAIATLDDRLIRAAREENVPLIASVH